jgi:hypothetical protein
MTEHTHEWRDKEPPQWKRTPNSFGPSKWTETAFITRVCDCGAEVRHLASRDQHENTPELWAAWSAKKYAEAA